MIISAKLHWSACAEIHRPSTHMQPTLHRSILVLYVRDPSRTSGARYHNVTTWTFSQPQDACQNPSKLTHLVTERIDGHTKSSRQTEITNLELASSVDEQVLGLEITVQDAVLVAEGDTLDDSASPSAPTRILPHIEELMRKVPDCVEIQRAAITMRVHVLLEI